MVSQAGERARRDVEHLGSVGNRAGLCALSALKCAKTFKGNSVEWASQGSHVPDQRKTGPFELSDSPRLSPREEVSPQKEIRMLELKESRVGVA